MTALPTLSELIDSAPATMWVETFRRLHFDALVRARNAGVRVTALGPLVDDGCPACHHPDHDPGSCEWCPRCELHTDDALEWLLRIEPELAAGVQVAAPPSDPAAPLDVERLRERVILAAFDVDGAWDAEDKDGAPILWHAEAGEVLADLRAAIEALGDDDTPWYSVLREADTPIRTVTTPDGRVYRPDDGETPVRMIPEAK